MNEQDNKSRGLPSFPLLNAMETLLRNIALIKVRQIKIHPSPQWIRQDFLKQLPMMLQTKQTLFVVNYVKTMALFSNGFHTECHCSHHHGIGYYRHDVLALLTKAIASLLHLAIYSSHNPSLSVLPSIYLLKREQSQGSCWWILEFDL